MKKLISFVKAFCNKNEKGAALVTGLLLVLVLTILSMVAMMTTGAELKITRNDRSAKTVFYLAEAGIEDARSRMQGVASSSPIYDAQPTNASWNGFIGPEVKCKNKGYLESNSNHIRYSSLNPSMNYIVTITHKLDASGNILRWGDSSGDGIPEENTTTGKNIYIITSEGYSSDGASKPISVEASPIPDITVPAALYTKANTTIQGNSTYVIGLDKCGTTALPGIISMSTVTQNGMPHIDGSPPIVPNSIQNIDIQYMINQFKGNSNYPYELSSATLTGMSWGSPAPGATPQDATNCNDHNVVYFNTNSTYVKLMGGSTGCGLLLVEGDLHVSGGFTWYGAVIVTGSIVFSGGGEKNVTGAMLAGGTVSADLVSGDANLLYCSEAISKQTSYLPLKIHRWAEMFL
jgi:Tfp pilus assembly protein PilX